MNIKAITSLLKRKTPEVLLGIGLIGVAALIPLSARAGRKKYIFDQTTASPTRKDRIKETAKDFALPAAVGIVTAGCFIFAYKIPARKLAKAVSIGAAAGRLLKQKDDSIKEVFGEEGLKKVRNAEAEKCENEYYCAQPKYISNGSMFVKSDPIKTIDEHDCKVYLEYENMTFATSKAGVLAAMYFTNRNFTYAGCISLYEFYEMLGLEDCPFVDIERAKVMGWDVNYLAEDYDAYFIDFDFEESDETDEDGFKKCTLSFPYPLINLEHEYGKS